MGKAANREKSLANALSAFAAFVAEAPGDWPDRALSEARRAVLDTVGCMIAGAGEDAPGRAFAAARAWGAGPCAVIGQTERLAAPSAALIGGTAAHALDFDDLFDPPKAHGSAALVPAILAFGDAREISGADALDAYTVGLEVLGRVGQGMNPHHRNRGWHATATLGTVGVAAAVARLLKLDAEKAAHALSLATSFAAGSMAQFGTLAKPLHAGLAAQGGLMAALLAEAGITAGTETFDGPHGMQRLMVGPDLEALRRGLTGEEYGQRLDFPVGEIGAPLLVETYGLKFKRFPNCASVHRPLDGLLELKAAHGFGPDDVTGLHIRAPKHLLANLMYPDPQTPAEAKFSLEYGLAVGLETGDNTLADFTPEAIQRPEIRKLMSLVTSEPVDALEMSFPTEITITLIDGQTLQTAVKMAVGSYAQPLSDDALIRKFHTCAAARPAEMRDRLAALCMGLDAVTSTRELTKLF